MCLAEGHNSLDDSDLACTYTVLYYFKSFVQQMTDNFSAVVSSTHLNNTVVNSDEILWLVGLLVVGAPGRRRGDGQSRLGQVLLESLCDQDVTFYRLGEADVHEVCIEVLGARDGAVRLLGSLLNSLPRNAIRSIRGPYFIRLLAKSTANFFPKHKISGQSEYQLFHV